MLIGCITFETSRDDLGRIRDKIKAEMWPSRSRPECFKNFISGPSESFRTSSPEKISPHSINSTSRFTVVSFIEFICGYYRNVGIDAIWRRRFTPVFLRAPIKIRKLQQNSSSIAPKIAPPICACRNSFLVMGRLRFNRGMHVQVYLYTDFLFEIKRSNANRRLYGKANFICVY